MIVWLDQRIFGNGYGLKSPFWDDTYYWLRGEFYTWSGWYGSQLQSFQWRHPKPGETRRIAGRDFRPFLSTREWRWFMPIPRVRVSWALVDLPDDITKASAQLHELRGKLGTTQ